MVKTYTVVGRCVVSLYRCEFGGKTVLGLTNVEFENEVDTIAVWGKPDENDGGEFACWDAGANFENGTLVISGADGPSGGSDDVSIRLVIPQHLITKLEIDDEL